MNLDNARRFAALTRRKKDLEAEVRSLNTELERVGDALLNDMLNEGVPNLPLGEGDNAVTLYVHRQVWASCKDANARAVLRSFGGGDLIEESVNAQRLSSFVREALRSGILPPHAVEALNVNERVQVRVRSGGRAESPGAEAARQLRDMNSET